jgi:hypothetical protein
VGSGEEEVVGVEDGTAVTVGTALGAVGLAEGVGLAEVGVGVEVAAPQPLSLVGTGTGVAVPPEPLVGTGLALALATAVGVTQDGLVGEATGSGVPGFPVGLAAGVPAGAAGAADEVAWWAAFLAA